VQLHDCLQPEYVKAHAAQAQNHPSLHCSLYLRTPRETSPCVLLTTPLHLAADVLAGRKTVGQISGAILFSGVSPTQTFLRRYTGYVEQFGAQPLLPSLLLLLCLTSLLCTMSWKLRVE